MSGLAAVLAPLTVFSGCRGRQGEGVSPDSAVSAPDRRNAEVTILVRNNHLLDMTIYLIRGGNPERLGTAPGLSTRIFSLPWRRVEGHGSLRLGADPLGQNRMIRTDFLIVRPSSIVEWTIQNDPNQSSVMVQ